MTPQELTAAIEALRESLSEYREANKSGGIALHPQVGSVEIYVDGTGVIMDEFGDTVIRFNSPAELAGILTEK